MHRRSMQCPVLDPFDRDRESETLNMIAGALVSLKSYLVVS